MRIYEVRRIQSRVEKEENQERWNSRGSLLVCAAAKAPRESFPRAYYILFVY